MKKVFLALMAVAAIALTGCDKSGGEPQSPQDPQPQERQIDPNGKATVTLCFYVSDTVASCMDFTINDVTNLEKPKSYTEGITKRALDTTNVNDKVFYQLAKIKKGFHGAEHLVTLEMPITLAAGNYRFEISGDRNSTKLEKEKIDMVVGSSLIFDANNQLLSVIGGEAFATGATRVEVAHLKEVFNGLAIGGASLRFSFKVYKE